VRVVRELHDTLVSEVRAVAAKDWLPLATDVFNESTGLRQVAAWHRSTDDGHWPERPWLMHESCISGPSAAPGLGHWNDPNALLHVLHHAAQPAAGSTIRRRWGRCSSAFRRNPITAVSSTPANCADRRSYISAVSGSALASSQACNKTLGDKLVILGPGAW